MFSISALILFFTLPLGVPQRVASDSIPGRLIKQVTTRGQFVSFDKNHADRFFFRDASDEMEMNMVMTEPETDLFLADHSKDDLKITYQIRDLTQPGGKTEWLNYATSIRSLKTGDDAKIWPEKMASDSMLLQSCQEQLRQLSQ
ncbi:MAG TPA: hypothetical protein VFH95_02160 [Candidatus Kapabacteria bacterium]|nr:hypothetical protein [Candidatus Kapabacteria bacterium]